MKNKILPFTIAAGAGVLLSALTLLLTQDLKWRILAALVPVVAAGFVASEVCNDDFVNTKHGVAITFGLLLGITAGLFC